MGVKITSSTSKKNSGDYYFIAIQYSIHQFMVKGENPMFVCWLVYIHVLSAITFFLAHGTSHILFQFTLVCIALDTRLKPEVEFARLAAPRQV
jgi:hypothetical protein